MGSTRPLVPQVPDRFNHAMVLHIPHRFLGFNHLLVPQVPDRFLGFNRGTVGIVEGVNFGNCPNYVALNAPLRRTIFGMGGDVFLTGMPFTNRNHATSSTGSKQVPWVQPRHWFHSSRQVLRVETRNGSTSSRQFPWVQQRHWFHRFQTGSLGSTVELWELWRVWISVTVQTTFCLMHHCAAPFWSGRGYVFDRNAECLSRIETTPLVPQVPNLTGSLGSTTPLVPQLPDRFLGFKHAMVPQVPHRFLGFNHLLVPQVPDRFLGFNRGTVGIVEGVNFGNCPNYVALNAPLRRTIFGMGGDVFLTGMPFTNRNHATSSTGSKQVPWVQPRHWFHSSRQVLRVETRNGSTSSRQFPWVQQRHWFHRFQTGSLGSTVELWELWRVWISVTVQTTFCLMHHCAAPIEVGGDTFLTGMPNAFQE